MMQLLCALVAFHLILTVRTAPSTDCARPSLPTVKYTGHETSFTNGQTIDVYCKEEYEDIQPTIQCHYGQWTSPSPECKLVVCPLPSRHPPNGAFTAPCNKFNCKATYTCHQGYLFNGTEMVCQRNSQWTDPNGLCKKVLCPELPYLAKGKILQADRSYKAEATMVCDEGYIYSLSSTTRECQGDNTWSGQQGKCESVLCPILRDPSHGKIIVKGRTYLSTAQVNCDMGYVFSKHNILLCQGNNTWRNANGTCERIGCPDLKKVENGILTARTGRFGDTVILQCPSGHILDGPSTITCKANGNWSATMGFCSKPGQNKSDPLLPALLVPILLLIIACCLVLWWLFCWKRRSLASDRYVEEDLPLIQRTKDLCCSFTLNKDFSNEYTDVGSPEYMLFEALIKKGVNGAIKETLDIDVEVNIVYLCQKKKKAFIEMIYTLGMEEEDVSKAIKKATFGKDYQDNGTEYKVVSGSVVFREKAVNRILADIHRKGHVTDKSPDHPIDFDTQYVTLKLLKQQRMDVMHTGLQDRPDHHQHGLEKFHGKKIEEEELIESDEYEKFVLVRGRAGIGKTTLGQQFLWKWATGGWVTKFKVMIMLNLRYIMTIDKPVSLPRLLSLYGVYTTGDADTSVHAEWLKRNEEKVGFILDGLDEIQTFRNYWEKGITSPTDLTGERKPLEWCFALMARQCLPKSTMIVSSRPFADLALIVNYFNAKRFSGNLKLIELMGLTRDRIMEFVEKNTPEHKVEFVKQTLQNNPVLMSVSSITFYCAALCELLVHEKDMPDKLNTYTRITAYIMQLYMNRSAQSGTPVKEFDERIQPHLEWLSDLAYNGLVNMDSRGLPRLVFDQDCFQDLDDETILQLRRTGLLLQTEIPDPEKKDCHRVLSQFIHLSIQEFLAMVGLLKKHPENVQQVFSKLCLSESFSMATVFIYGLAFNKEDNMIKNIMDAVGGTFDGQEEIQRILKESVLNVSDDLHALQVAHESQSIEIVKEMGQQRFQKKICLQGDKLTIVDTTALVLQMNNNDSAHILQLGHADMDQYSVKELADFLANNKTLDTVKLFDNNFDDVCAESFMTAIGKNTRIHTLDLISDAITDEGAVHIGNGLEKNASINTLKFDGAGLTGKGVTTLVKALANSPKIEKIGLFCRNMTDEDMKEIGLRLIPRKTLAELSLSSRSLTDQGVAYAAEALKNNPMCRLASLSIDCQGITDKGVQHIADALMVNKTLDKLRLNSRRFTNVGVICIANMLKANTRLKDVSLLGFHMKQEGLSSILQTMKANKTVTVHIWPPGFKSKLTQEMEQEKRIQLV